MTDNGGARHELITDFVSRLLGSFGEDVSREGLVETPQRVSRMYEELLGGWKGLSDKGKLRFEGRDYVMTDGDVVEFMVGG